MTDSNKPEDALHQWRMRILNIFLVVASVVTGAMVLLGILDTATVPGQLPIMLLAGALVLALTALAILRGIDSRIRSWGFLIIIYAISVIALVMNGLGGSGRLFLLVLPIFALILIGARAGLLMSALSILTMAILAFLIDQGLAVQWLVGEKNSSPQADWLIQSIGMLGLLAILMTLLFLFYQA